MQSEIRLWNSIEVTGSQDVACFRGESLRHPSHCSTTKTSINAAVARTAIAPLPEYQPAATVAIIPSTATVSPATMNGVTDRNLDSGPIEVHPHNAANGNIAIPAIRTQTTWPVSRKSSIAFAAVTSTMAKSTQLSAFVRSTLGSTDRSFRSLVFDAEVKVVFVIG